MSIKEGGDKPPLFYLKDGRTVFFCACLKDAANCTHVSGKRYNWAVMVETQPTAVSTQSPATRFQLYSEHFTFFFLAFMAGLALSRLLFEAYFPQLYLLARPYAAFPFALLVAFGLWLYWQRPSARPPVAVFAPWLLNSLWLFNPSVDLVGSRFLFAAGLWLTAVNLWPPTKPKWRAWLWLAAALLPVYLLTMSHHVGAADTFEFQVVAPRLEIAHPTGYPLYLLLGKLFTLLPISSLAWRLNFASVVYALAAMACFYTLLGRLNLRPYHALLATAVMGLSLTFWSQAIIAEVYALHALLVMLALLALAPLGGWHSDPTAVQPAITDPRQLLKVAFLLGLGLTNHLTTVFLFLPTLFVLIWQLWPYRRRPWTHPWLQPRLLLQTAVAFAAPLLLYAYLPIRWQAINHEPMGLARFVDWVIGGRFQGALQWRAWLDDPIRYQIVGRLFLDNWGWFNLALAGLGLFFLLRRHWPTAVALLLLWVGNSFYALNYYVPDLAVFVGPAQLTVAIFWAMGLTAVAQQINLRTPPHLGQPLLAWLLLPSLLLAVAHWPLNDQSAHDGLESWGRQILALPLAEGAAILADSEKIAPLLYLQLAEQLRPDLDISVWPDEAAYLAQVNGRLAQGQTVYLARFLPGLQGSYHLRSLGPLTEVSPVPLTQLPAELTQPTKPIQFGPIRLLAYDLQPQEGQTAVTFYWQSPTAVDEVWQVYVRLAGQTAVGQHPANHFYPTNAWRAGEIVADYHQLAHPILRQAQTSWLEVALGPPFTAVEALDWQPVAELTLPPTTIGQLAGARPYRWQLGHTAVVAADFASQTRPQTPLPLVLAGFGPADGLQATLQPGDGGPNRLATALAPALAAESPFVQPLTVTTDVANGRYRLQLNDPTQTAVCGWLQPVTRGCVLDQVQISGVALPDTAVNYADQIALLDYQLSAEQLLTGGQLTVQFDWLALAPISQNYTLFLQLVDQQDRIVGQVDSWPVQGTQPTGQWEAGQTIADAHTIQLAAELPPGEYRLLVGWYLLADGRRLAVLDSAGNQVDDRLVISGLHVK